MAGTKGVDKRNDAVPLRHDHLGTLLKFDTSGAEWTGAGVVELELVDYSQPVTMILGPWEKDRP